MATLRNTLRGAAFAAMVPFATPIAATTAAETTPTKLPQSFSSRTPDSHLPFPNESYVLPGDAIAYGDAAKPILACLEDAGVSVKGSDYVNRHTNGQITVGHLVSERGPLEQITSIMPGHTQEEHIVSAVKIPEPVAEINTPSRRENGTIWAQKTASQANQCISKIPPGKNRIERPPAP